jgi:hypothetical protein
MKTETTHTHTPGPWSVETKGSRHFIDGADELSVAYVDRAGVRERQTYEANARLIAASPDLLAALEDIVRLATTSDFWLPKAWLDDAKAAIAKVEGNK